MVDIEKQSQKEGAIKKFFMNFWFLRGFFAAIAAFSILPDYLNISKYDFVRGFHALLVGWNQLAIEIGKWLGNLIGLPDLSAILINSIVLYSCTAMPILSQLSITEFRGRSEQMRLYEKMKFVVFHIAFLVSSGILITLVIYYFVLGGLPANLSALEDPWWQGKMFRAKLIYPVVVLGLFVMSIKSVQGFGRGLVFAVVFMSTFQILYFAPVAGGYIKTFSSHILNDAETQQRVNIDAGAKVMKESE